MEKRLQEVYSLLVVLQNSTAILAERVALIEPCSGSALHGLVHLYGNVIDHVDGLLKDHQS